MAQVGLPPASRAQAVPGGPWERACKRARPMGLAAEWAPWGPWGLLVVPVAAMLPSRAFPQAARPPAGGQDVGRREEGLRLTAWLAWEVWRVGAVAYVYPGKVNESKFYTLPNLLSFGDRFPLARPRAEPTQSAAAL